MFASWHADELTAGAKPFSSLCLIVPIICLSYFYCTALVLPLYISSFPSFCLSSSNHPLSILCLISLFSLYINLLQPSQHLSFHTPVVEKAAALSSFSCPSHLCPKVPDSEYVTCYIRSFSAHRATSQSFPSLL